MTILIPQNPDAWQALGDALLAEHDRADAEIQARMTPELAAAVRQLRVDEHATWGYIGKRFGAGQIVGRLLCYHAAVVLGENPHEEPWN